MNIAVARILIICLTAFTIGCGGQGTDSVDTSSDVGRQIEEVRAEDRVGSVTVRIHIPGGSPSLSTVDIDADDTVADVLSRLPDLQVVMQGSGPMTFVSQIGDLPTAGGQGWSYRVNGEWADRSVGVFAVSPGDQIEWTYGDFDASAPE